jgi:hypothetical protein
MAGEEFCKGCGTGGSEVRSWRAEIGNSRSNLILKPTAIKKEPTWVQNPTCNSNIVHKHLRTNNSTQGHGGRVKYTTLNEGNGNQVCRKTRQNKWKMKSGSTMARRPVTPTAEHRPNKERK